jgi:pSer/pThr/pTyr-binding forkhead associated (FHA) protein
VIADSKVSQFHARLDRTRDGFTPVDLKSTNGTCVNGKPITSAVLKPRDEIQLGPVKLRYAED